MSPIYLRYNLLQPNSKRYQTIRSALDLVLRKLIKELQRTNVTVTEKFNSKKQSLFL